MVIYEPIKNYEILQVGSNKEKDKYKIKKKMEQGTKAVGLVITFNSNHNYKNIQKRKRKNFQSTKVCKEWEHNSKLF